MTQTPFVVFTFPFVPLAVGIIRSLGTQVKEHNVWDQTFVKKRRRKGRKEEDSFVEGKSSPNWKNSLELVDRHVMIAEISCFLSYRSHTDRCHGEEEEEAGFIFRSGFITPGPGCLTAHQTGSKQKANYTENRWTKEDARCWYRAEGRMIEQVWSTCYGSGARLPSDPIWLYSPGELVLPPNLHFFLTFLTSNARCFEKINDSRCRSVYVDISHCHSQTNSDDGRRIDGTP